MTYAQPSMCNLTSTTVSQHKLSLPPKIQKSVYSHMLGSVLCPNYDDFIRKSFLLYFLRGITLLSMPQGISDSDSDSDDSDSDSESADALIDSAPDGLFDMYCDARRFLTHDFSFAAFVDQISYFQLGSTKSHDHSQNIDHELVYEISVPRF